MIGLDKCFAPKLSIHLFSGMRAEKSQLFSLRPAMDHYEELGLTSGAPAEEIGQAYRALARLVHPDGQSDDKLKAAAELQMKRLNGIQAVLTDPRRRAEYDASLRHPTAEVRQPRVRHAPRWFWALLGSAVLVMMVAWYGVPRESGFVAADVAPLPAEAPVAQAPARHMPRRATGARAKPPG